MPGGWKEAMRGQFGSERKAKKGRVTKGLK